MTDHTNHALIRATARLSRGGQTAYVLCQDCRVIVSEQRPGEAVTGGPLLGAPGAQR
jgi:hypothetical protein